MIGLSLRLRAQTLRGFYIICSPQPRQCAGAAGNAVEGIQRRQTRLERAHQLTPEQTAKRVEHQVVHVAQAVRAAEHEKQPRELPELDEHRKRQRHERDAAEIQTADVTQVHPERHQHQDVAHDLLYRAVEQRRQIRARIGAHERRLAQEIGHELKRHELRVIGRELRRLRSVRQREKHERQHTQNIKQKQAAEHGAHPVEAARTHLPAEKRHGDRRRQQRECAYRQPDTAQNIDHHVSLPWERSRPRFLTSV